MARPTTIVLGAGGGIGAACVAAFSGAGRFVVAADLDRDKAQAAIEGLGGATIARAADVTSPEALRALAEAATDFGPLTDLVYAPGLSMTAAIEDTDWARYRALMAVNLDGAFHAAAAAARVFKRQASGGAMVFVSSTAGRRGEAGASHYCASKFGLIGLAESLAAELGGHQIRVNTVCPGNVDTPMLADIAGQIARFRGMPEAAVWDLLRTSGAAHRLVTPAEVAAVCLMLCEPRASAVTGATLTVDAGASVG